MADLFTAIACMALIAPLLGGLLFICVIRHQPARAATAELSLSVVLTVQLIFSWHLIQSYAFGAIKFSKGLLKFKQSIVVGGSHATLAQELSTYFDNGFATLAAASAGA